MKQICILILMTIFICSITSACSTKQKPNMVQAQRRFAKYVTPTQSSQTGGVVDLSEGPKLNYDAKFGPQNVNFDVKIVDPY